MNGWMDAWVDGGWIGGRSIRWIDGGRVGWMDGCMHAWIDGLHATIFRLSRVITRAPKSLFLGSKNHCSW